MRPRTIGFLGFGEAARAFHASLAAAGLQLRFAAYDIKLTGQDAPALRQAISDAGVTLCEAATGLAGCDWIISAVTADQSLLAIQPLLPALKGGLVIDINSVSPDRKRDTARQIIATGAGYLDMAVMTPVHPQGHASKVLVAGAGLEDLLPVLTAMGFAATAAGDAPGQATAIKMVRSLFVKGLEAITVEALLAAEASGCFDTILASLSGSFPGLGWPQVGTYALERTTTHGARRAAEMEESAATLDALGLNGNLAREIAAVQRQQGNVGRQDEGELQDMLRLVLAQRLAGRT